MERIKNYGTTLLLCLVLLLQGCLKVDEEMFFFASASAEVSTDGITFSGTIDETIAQSSELGIEYWYEYYSDYDYDDDYGHPKEGGFSRPKELYVSREGNTFTGFLECSSELIYEEGGFAKYFAENGKLPIKNICYRTYWGDYEKEYGEVKTVPFTYDNMLKKGSENGYEWVDLGLPSGLKWATCNIGTSNSLGKGKTFAWGETSSSNGYDYWSDYKYADYYGDMTKYCTKSYYGTVDNKTVLEAEDDAARVNMGGKWRMPTEEDWQELFANCTTGRVLVVNDSYSYYNSNYYISIIMGKNGNFIFLPIEIESEYNYIYDNIPYWSSSLDVEDPRNAYCYGHFSDVSDRKNAYAIRGVCE